MSRTDYSVEWRVVNAAEYGASQRRRRTFIFAYKNVIQSMKKYNQNIMENIMLSEGLMAKAFPVNAVESITHSARFRCSICIRPLKFYFKTWRIHDKWGNIYSECSGGKEEIK